MFFIFVFYSLAGWCIDSGYRSMVDRRWSRGGFSPLPFTPSYGLGAVMLVAVGPSITPLSYLSQWILLGLLFAAYEYACGHLSILFVRRRLWDYSEGFLNVHGHTDLLHGLYWATLSLLTLHWFHPWLMAVAGT